MKVSKMVHKLRTELCKEHFGTDYDVVSDPVDMKDAIVEIAKKNDEVYFEIFKCEPTNSIKTFADVVIHRKDKDETRVDIETFKRVYMEKKD
jgi:hypothetical protein